MAERVTAEQLLDDLTAIVRDAENLLRATAAQGGEKVEEVRAKAEESLRHQEAKLAEARQQIAGFDATIRHERGATADHEAELLRVGRHRADLGYRLKGLEAEVGKAAADVTAAEDRLRAEQDSADAASAELAAVSSRVADLDQQFQADQARQMDLVRRAASARSTAEATLAQVERFQKEYTRKLGEIEQTAARRAALESALDGLSRVDADLQARLTAAHGRLTETTAEQNDLRAEQERAQQGLAGLRVRQGDLRGRIEVAIEQDDAQTAQEALEDAKTPMQNVAQQQASQQQGQEQGQAGQGSTATATAEPPQTAQEQAGQQTGQQAAAPLAGIPASELLGQAVVNDQGETVAEIVDLVKRGDSEDLFAILSVGGFLGIGEKQVSVPLDRFDVGQNQEIILSGATQEQIKNMPSYEDDGTFQSIDRQG